MSKALLLVLLLPLAQEDPQVTYREGLFEEVDQGNLEKAAELYAKVLKSNATDALKAKALFRTGFCHEKKGKKKEAEQAWRDVIERYPGAAETVRLARERLARPEESMPATVDGQIQAAILDLGAADESQRRLAVRKLVLMADTAAADLKRAMQHKDRLLSLGAARVMIELEQWDGVYETFRRHYPDFGGEDALALGRLIQKRDEDRARFFKDAALFYDGPLVGRLATTLSKMGTAGGLQLLEEWMANAKIADSSWEYPFQLWRAAVGDEEMGRFITHLTDTDLPKFSKVQKLLPWITTETGVGPATHKAILLALQRHPDPATLMSSEPAQLRPYLRLLDTEALFRGPIADWMNKPDDAFRTKALETVFTSGRLANGYKDMDKARELIFAMLADTKIPLKVRQIGILNAPWGSNEDYTRFMSQYLALCLEYFRVNRAEFKPPPADSKTQNVVGINALRSLGNQLPPDSKDLPEVLDVLFDFPQGISHAVSNQAREQAIRVHLLPAAVRAVQRGAEQSQEAIFIIDRNGTAEQQLQLGSVVPVWKVPKTAQALASAYTKGLSRIATGEEPAWKEFQKTYDASSDSMKVWLAQGLSSSRGGLRADAFMKAALDAGVDGVRNAAIQYWRYSESADKVPLLLKALNDKNPENQITAIQAVGALRVLEAVPELISRFLSGGPGGLREQATAALKLIREHYEERAQWQRWYDETKKALNK